MAITLVAVWRRGTISIATPTCLPLVLDGKHPGNFRLVARYAPSSTVTSRARLKSCCHGIIGQGDMWARLLAGANIIRELTAWILASNWTARPWANVVASINDIELHLYRLV